MHPLVDFSVPRNQLAVHWFGQSSFAVKTSGGVIVHVDPYFPSERPAERFIHDRSPLDESTLPVRAVLLTHDHLDHTDPETLKRIHAAFPDVLCAGPSESCARAIEAAGLPEAQCRHVAAGDEWAWDDLTIHAVFAKPREGDPAEGIPRPDITHLGYVLVSGEASVYITGDPIRTFAKLDALVSPVRALRPKVGFLTCHPTEGEFPFFDDAVQMAKRIGLKQAFPSHYQCFVKRTYDPWAWARAFDGTGIRARVLQYNEWVCVP